jgi:hypothetical protein
MNFVKLDVSRGTGFSWILQQICYQYSFNIGKLCLTTSAYVLQQKHEKHVFPEALSQTFKF